MQQPAWQLGCPVSLGPQPDRVSLAHGEGGRLMRRLIEENILPRFAQDGEVKAPPDAAILPEFSGELAFTTDSFVVSPLFFPGGDIGRLAIIGTMNDLAVAGALPMWISLSLIIEEGLPLPVLESVLESAAQAAREAGVQVVAGDTKVVPAGAADGLFITTSGIGRVLPPPPLGPETIQPGDELIVSGPVGRHGIAILAAREQLGLIPPPETDCACLFDPVNQLRITGLMSDDRNVVRAIRDATRGGVTAILHEWSQACGHTLTVRETAVPTTPDTRGSAELLGLDPLQIACEGTMLIAVKQGVGEAVVQALRNSPQSREAAVIGEVRERGLAPVTIQRSLGTEQPLDEPSGAMLPRIC
ncbi:MAG: hydrogenase expression/formation protein HypE [Planctomycetaceae bacterium]|nr:hydrogenase expression/formation protein HypE [Planctomycetaceae bacterium]